jgi:hypothetical protein
LNAITGWTRMLLDKAVEPANTRKAPRSWIASPGPAAAGYRHPRRLGGSLPES